MSAVHLNSTETASAHCSYAVLMFDDCADYVAPVHLACASLRFCRTKLHNLRITHRDLKPENLMLTAQDDVIIADFGIAHIKKSVTNCQSTTTRDAQGTFNYMAPEALDPDLFDGITTKLDLWSLAACAVQMLSGEMPFAGFQIIQIMRKVVDAKEHPQIPPGTSLSPLLTRCFMHNPTQRCSAEEMLREMEPLLESAEQMHMNACVICLERFCESSGILCSGQGGPSDSPAPHFTCMSCLGIFVASECSGAGPLEAHPDDDGEIAVACPLRRQGCSDTALPWRAVVRAITPNEGVYKAYMAATRRLAVAKHEKVSPSSAAVHCEIHCKNPPSPCSLCQKRGF